MFYLVGLVALGTLCLIWRLRFLNQKLERERFEMLNECKDCKCSCNCDKR